MTLKNYLYKVLNVKDTPEGGTYSISLNQECPIYKAHFPTMPITPGACIIQMVEELLEDHLKINLQTAGVKNAKFLRVLKPTDEVICINLAQIQEQKQIQKIKAQATITDRTDTVYAKISLICNVV